MSEIYVDSPLPTRAPAAETHALTFSGSGGEYFRIWIVNLCLTIVTLGIYSAWAKVRRVRYFDRNTHLAGAVFDFDGKPLPILRGRLIAVALVVTYQYAYGLSLAFGCALAAFIVLTLPYLLCGALRFRLHNTRYRGLRFGFNGTVADAYRAYVPIIVTILLPGLLTALHVPLKWVALSASLYLLWPLMYGAAKRFQHRNLAYGALDADFALPARAFYRPYLVAAGLSLAGFIATFLLLMLFAVGTRGLFSGEASRLAGTLGAIVTAVLFGYVAYLVTGPFLQARVANLAWSHTTLPGVTIRSTIPPGGFVWLQTVNTLLTLLTLGLYRPFAVVRAYRYRLAHTAVILDGDAETILAGAEARTGSGHADAAADFLGVELAW